MAESKFLKRTQGNGASTTLSASITNADTSAPLTSDTAFDGEGMLLIDEGQATEEFAYGTGKLGSSITILADDRGLEGGSAQSHSDSATVKGIITSGMWNNMVEAVSKTVSETDGTLVTATASDVATGTDNTKFTTPLAVAPYANNSIYRQAIINGNFDVWQRGTTLTPADATVTFLADRWGGYIDKNGGTLPTLTMSRQAVTAGALDGSYYHWRLNANGAGTSLGASSYGYTYNRIENGTRYLCGNGKKVTVSFWAKSDIANKRICATLTQSYGTGGSPSASEQILGTPITLTSSWVKYTSTFTTNTLSGKTFGTANDDYLSCNIWYMWGTTTGNALVQASVTAETFVGAGNIDIAQVQLCAGDVALPFMPKSYEEELRACQRYCYAVTSTGANEAISDFGTAASATAAFASIQLPVEMRIEPTLTATAGDWKVADFAADSIDLSALAINSGSNTKQIILAATVVGGLTQFRPYVILSNGASRVFILSAEL